MARNLVKEGISGSLIIPYPFMAQKAVEDKVDMSCDIVICSPDNDEAKVFVSRHFYHTAPVVFKGLGRNATTGYVFVH